MPPLADADADDDVGEGGDEDDDDVAGGHVDIEGPQLVDVTDLPGGGELDDVTADLYAAELFARGTVLGGEEAEDLLAGWEEAEQAEIMEAPPTLEGPPLNTAHLRELEHLAAEHPELDQVPDEALSYLMSAPADLGPPPEQPDCSDPNELKLG
jgi:hypothetical protein